VTSNSQWVNGNREKVGAVVEFVKTHHRALAVAVLGLAIGGVGGAGLEFTHHPIVAKVIEVFGSVTTVVGIAGIFAYYDSKNFEESAKNLGTLLNQSYSTGRYDEARERGQGMQDSQNPQ